MQVSGNGTGIKVRAVERLRAHEWARFPRHADFGPRGWLLQVGRRVGHKQNYFVCRRCGIILRIDVWTDWDVPKREKRIHIWDEDNLPIAYCECDTNLSKEFSC